MRNARRGLWKPWDPSIKADVLDVAARFGLTLEFRLTGLHVWKSMAHLRPLCFFDFYSHSGRIYVRFQAGGKHYGIARSHAGLGRIVEQLLKAPKTDEEALTALGAGEGEQT